jgi:hypothetical protein
MVNLGDLDIIEVVFGNEKIRPVKDRADHVMPLFGMMGMDDYSHQYVSFHVKRFYAEHYRVPHRLRFQPAADWQRKFRATAFPKSAYAKLAVEDERVYVSISVDIEGERKEVMRVYPGKTLRPLDSYLPRIIEIAKQIDPFSGGEGDIVQEGYTALQEAAQKYSVRRSMDFWEKSEGAVRQRMKAFITKQRSRHYTDVSESVPVAGTDDLTLGDSLQAPDDTEHHKDSMDAEQILRYLSSKAPPEHIKIFRRLLDGERMVDVAQAHNLSVSQVFRIRARLTKFAKNFVRRNEALESADASLVPGRGCVYGSIREKYDEDMAEEFRMSIQPHVNPDDPSKVNFRGAVAVMLKMEQRFAGFYLGGFYYKQTGVKDYHMRYFAPQSDIPSEYHPVRGMNINIIPEDAWVGAENGRSSEGFLGEMDLAFKDAGHDGMDSRRVQGKMTKLHKAAKSGLAGFVVSERGLVSVENIKAHERILTREVKTCIACAFQAGNRAQQWHGLAHFLYLPGIDHDDVRELREQLNAFPQIISGEISALRIILGRSQREDRKLDRLILQFKRTMHRLFPFAEIVEVMTGFRRMQMHVSSEMWGIQGDYSNFAGMKAVFAWEEKLGNKNIVIRMGKHAPADIDTQYPARKSVASLGVTDGCVYRSIAKKESQAKADLFLKKIRRTQVHPDDHRKVLFHRVLKIMDELHIGPEGYFVRQNTDGSWHMEAALSEGEAEDLRAQGYEPLSRVIVDGRIIPKAWVGADNAAARVGFMFTTQNAEVVADTATIWIQEVLLVAIIIVIVRVDQWLYFFELAGLNLELSAYMLEDLLWLIWLLFLLFGEEIDVTIIVIVLALIVETAAVRLPVLPSFIGIFYPPFELLMTGGYLPHYYYWLLILHPFLLPEKSRPHPLPKIFIYRPRPRVKYIYLTQEFRVTALKDIQRIKMDRRHFVAHKVYRIIEFYRTRFANFLGWWFMEGYTEASTSSEYSLI